MQNLLGLQFRWVFWALTLFHTFHKNETHKKEALYTPWSEVIYLNSVSPEPESLPHMEINDVPIFKYYKWDLKKNTDKVFHSYEWLNTFFICLYLFIFAFVNLELNLLASLPSTVWLRCHHFVKFSLLSLYVKKRKYNLK